MSSNWNPRYYVVLPAFNESRYLDDVLKALKKYTTNIVVVDDGSSDNTTQQAEKHTPHVLTHPINLGKGAAMKTGSDYVFSQLGGSAVIFMDSDAQHDPHEVLKFVEVLNQGKHLVLGVRDTSSKMPVMRAAANQLASQTVKLFFGTYIPDIPSGYKGMTKEAYDQLRWNAQSYDVEMEIAVRTAKRKIPFTVIPIETIYLDTDKGMTFLDAGRMIAQILEWKIKL